MCIMRAGLSWLQILGDIFRFLAFCLRTRTSLAAENLFLPKQLVPFTKNVRSGRDVLTIQRA